MLFLSKYNTEDDCAFELVHYNPKLDAFPILNFFSHILLLYLHFLEIWNMNNVDIFLCFSSSLVKPSFGLLYCISFSLFQERRLS